MPVSCSLIIAIICSSVNRERLIIRLLRCEGLYQILEEVQGLRSAAQPEPLHSDRSMQRVLFQPTDGSQVQPTFDQHPSATQLSPLMALHPGQKRPDVPHLTKAIRLSARGYLKSTEVHVAQNGKIQLAPGPEDTNTPLPRHTALPAVVSKISRPDFAVQRDPQPFAEIANFDVQCRLGRCA